jgi:hypothetical protein
MTDAQDDAVGDDYEWDPENDPDGYTHEDVFPQDQALDATLNVFGGDAGKSEMTMSLVVGGVVISGYVISRQEWQRRTVELLSASSDGPSAPLIDALEEMWSEVHSTIEKEKERREAENLLSARDEFFHMRDARIGGVGGISVPVWRGLRASITGWTFGIPN